MDRDRVIAYCLAKPGAEETYPFGEDVLVAKVGGKMFALLDPNGESVNLKCDPELALALRQQYPQAVTPGYHMNKKHWNTVQLDRSLPDDEIAELIDQSYDIVLASLPKRVRLALGADA